MATCPRPCIGAGSVRGVSDPSPTGPLTLGHREVPDEGRTSSRTSCPCTHPEIPSQPRLELMIRTESSIGARSSLAERRPNCGPSTPGMIPGTPTRVHHPGTLTPGYTTLVLHHPGTTPPWVHQGTPGYTTGYTVHAVQWSGKRVLGKRGPNRCGERYRAERQPGTVIVLIQGSRGPGRPLYTGV